MFKKLFGKKVHKVLFCEKNLERFFDDEELDEFLAIHHIEINEYECLSHCQLCEKSIYAEIDGKVIEADDTKQLAAKIKEYVGMKN